MRNAFADEMFKIAEADQRIVLLSADIGNRLFDQFKKAFPERFYNCGIAEANMISLAAGLASAGLKPVCYTITPFVTTRCLEQIKIDVCYHNMPVTIVGTGSGLSYASLGSTHHSFEDLAILRVLPKLKIVAPADAVELRMALHKTFTQDSPVYIRIGKKGEPLLTNAQAGFNFASWQNLHSGEDAIILACGTILEEALHAAKILSKDNISVAVWSCASVKPLDENLLTSLPNIPILTLEEHSLIGGFGSAVLEFLADRAISKNVIRCGIPDNFLHDCGELQDARATCRIDANSIVERIKSIMTKPTDSILTR